ncbi:hypothetical protein BFL36_09740 [Clavibacter michiganensis]|uniref:DUF86 domain-containing protein n=1 Tax=Clavibacter michiganensis TaxID=28447 RepID=A0A251YET2_9MICO|nr:HepT-like ribonuclease domain-containing protein [Clavibacter michiganensis]OUE22755.1 hypothetical protein BFL36_09740 [Clavibacter michiganensis]
MIDGERVPALLEDIARFAASARRVTARGHARFVDPEDDEQRRIARSLVIDLSTAADRLPSSFREARPEIDWSGIRAVRNFVAHDYDGTDVEVLWRVIAVEFPRIEGALAE